MNDDKKNIYQHYANCFQAFGFSLLGAQQMVMGKAPTNPTDKAMLKAYKDPSKSGAETQEYLVNPQPNPTGTIDAKPASVLSGEADYKSSDKPGFLHWDEDIGKPNKPGFWDD
jgi:hypothetical protein